MFNHSNENPNHKIETSKVEQPALQEKYTFICNEMQKANDWLKLGGKLDKVMVENLLFLAKYGNIEHRIYSLKILASLTMNFQITQFSPLDGVKFLNEAAKLGDQNSIIAINNIDREILTEEERNELNSFTYR